MSKKPECTLAYRYAVYSYAYTLRLGHREGFGRFQAVAFEIAAKYTKGTLALQSRR